MARTSLLDPIPELELAAKLLDAATDAVLLGNLHTARSLLELADMPEVIGHVRRLVSTLSPEVHGNTKRPRCLPKGERDSARMPSRQEELAIYTRDGWRCRFCGIKVISRKARGVLAKRLGISGNWASNKQQANSALYALASSLDHVVPHGRGGRNDVENLITACYGCQFGRGEWTLEEVGLADPRLRPPTRDAWDGLTRLHSLPNNSSTPTPLRGAA